MELQYVPVDTIICFRASCPLVIAVIEYFYLDRELPSARSWVSLLGAIDTTCHLPMTVCLFAILLLHHKSSNALLPKPPACRLPAAFMAAQCILILTRKNSEICVDRLVPAGVFGGVAVYTFHDIHFTAGGYVWLGIWYSFAIFEMVYVKKVVDTVEMTTWSRTYFQVTPSSNLYTKCATKFGRHVFE